MPSVILFNSGGDQEVRISPHSKETAAKMIADAFHHYSTDEETTSVAPADVEVSGVAWGDKPIPALEVILTNPAGDDGSGPDHTLATVLDFSPEAVAWALKEVNPEVDNGLTESGALAPLTAKDAPHLVEELCGIMDKYGSLATPQMTHKLRKALERVDALSKFAQSAWNGCMANPESLSRIPAPEKERAKAIIEELSKVQPAAPAPKAEEPTAEATPEPGKPTKKPKAPKKTKKD